MSMIQAQRAIPGNTKVAAPLSKTAPRASNAVAFFRVTDKIHNLPLNAADRAAVKIDKAKEENNHRNPYKRTSTRPLKRGSSKPPPTVDLSIIETGYLSSPGGVSCSN
jgi:hypothetical protein